MRRMVTNAPPDDRTRDTADEPGPEHEHAEGFRHSYTKDQGQLLRRVSRIEGQVRGIGRMIERDEYCVDILQQTSALRAAVDALAVLVLEDHVQGCVRTAAERGEALGHRRRQGQTASELARGG